MCGRCCQTEIFILLEWSDGYRLRTAAKEHTHFYLFSKACTKGYLVNSCLTLPLNTDIVKQWAIQLPAALTSYEGCAVMQEGYGPGTGARSTWHKKSENYWTDVCQTCRRPSQPTFLKIFECTNLGHTWRESVLPSDLCVVWHWQVMNSWTVAMELWCYAILDKGSKRINKWILWTIGHTNVTP